MMGIYACEQFPLCKVFIGRIGSGGRNLSLVVGPGVCGYVC